MRLFGKEKQIEKSEAAVAATVEQKPSSEKKLSSSNGSFEAELTRLKAQVDSLGELRKVFGERFSTIHETLGELRGMIIETNKDLQNIRVKTTKSVDLVEAVQPDKLMTELRKQDVKIEVLKANIESNEARMETILNELRELRNKLNAFRGIEEIVKLSQEVKDELIDIRKVKSVAERHSDKIESMFIDFQNRIKELTGLEDDVKANKANLEKLLKDFDELKLGVLEKAEKKDVDKIIKTSREFENHTTRAITLLNRVFIEFEQDLKKEFDTRLAQLDGVEGILKELAKESPNLDKNIGQLNELIQKQMESKKSGSKKKGLLARLTGKKKEGSGEKKEGSSGGEDIDLKSLGIEE
ncbi:hypothetical protein KY320_00465 [Candidatus Woesearchaeota archaeon]|nr:hypothetical protein [Candidatus Woesearchaeota archaeon]